MHKKPIKRPSFFLYFTEAIRAIFELIRYYLFRWFRKIKPDGDGHPIMVIPGFLSSDLATGPLRRFIKSHGYDPHPWGLGRNMGDLNDLPVLVERMEMIVEQRGEKLTLIGWSLGGVYARELAKNHAHLVRQVITLGSPFAAIEAPNWASWVFEMIYKGKPEIDRTWIDNLPKPAPVPTTAIYSKMDGIVPWQACMEIVEGEIYQNIEVSSSHLGMGVHPTVLKIIAYRLRSAGYARIEETNDNTI